MKSILVLCLVFTCFCSYGQQAQPERKTPELKIATEPVAPKNDKKPELKLVDPSTANEKKMKERRSGTPELKLLSK